MISNLGGCFALRCFQRLSVPNDSYPAMLLGGTTGKPEVSSGRSSRTIPDSPQKSTLAVDRDQPVSRISIVYC